MCVPLVCSCLLLLFLFCMSVLLCYDFCFCCFSLRTAFRTLSHPLRNILDPFRILWSKCSQVSDKKKKKDKEEEKEKRKEGEEEE